MDIEASSYGVLNSLLRTTGKRGSIQLGWWVAGDFIRFEFWEMGWRRNTTRGRRTNQEVVVSSRNLDQPKW